MPKIRRVSNLKHILIARHPPFRFSCRVSKPWIFTNYWLPSLLWRVVIFGASADPLSYQHSSNLIMPLLRWLFPHLPYGRLEAIHHFLSKCAHFTEYAILALLLLVFLYAASDEFHQSCVPGRTALFSDVLIDTAGGAAGLLAGRLFYRLRKKDNLP